MLYHDKFFIANKTNEHVGSCNRFAAQEGIDEISSSEDGGS